MGAGPAIEAGLLGLMLHMKFTAGGDFFECAGVTDLMMSYSDVALISYQSIGVVIRMASPAH